MDEKEQDKLIKKQEKNLYEQHRGEGRVINRVGNVGFTVGKAPRKKKNPFILNIKPLKTQSTDGLEGKKN